MDIDKLKLFKHLAGTLHFGRTSRACNITPSALTRTIQRMEEEVGKKLFIRDNRTVLLTDAGRRFKKYAEESIQQWLFLQNDLSADGEILQGDISLYCSVTASYSILPRMLKNYRQAFPQIHINLQTGDEAYGLSKLQNGEVDVTIAALPESLPAQLEFIGVVDTPLLFIASKDFLKGVHGGKINWKETPMIMAERGLGRVRLDNWFKKRDIRPNIYAQVARNEAIITLVSLGCGIGVVPQLVLEKSPMQEQVLPLQVSPELEPFSVGVCTAKKNLLNPAIRAFWEIARHEVQQ